METKCKACGEDGNGRQYCHQCETVAVFRGYAKWQLFEAFSMVQDKANWKNPINAVISPSYDRADSKRLIEAAVIFYAGCTPTFTSIRRKTSGGTLHSLRVEAAGYYAAVGA